MNLYLAIYLIVAGTLGGVFVTFTLLGMAMGDGFTGSSRTPRSDYWLAAIVTTIAALLWPVLVCLLPVAVAGWAWDRMRDE